MPLFPSDDEREGIPPRPHRRIDMTASQPCTTDAKHLAVAGGISCAAWCVLAWRSHYPEPALPCLLAVLSITWIALIWALARIPSLESKAILGFAIGFRMLALVAVPVLEDDHHRFLWDGYRFAATGNPYAEPPRARFADDAIPPEFRAVLDRINHAEVPTVYGPFTQWAFRLGHTIAPAQLWPWKLILLGAELAILALLWPSLGARGRLLLAWCPLAVFETGFNAHPDVLAIALAVAAWRLGRSRHIFAAGVAAGLAVAAKIFALPLVPFLLWRLGRRAWAGAGAAVLALYAPFWLRGSAADFAGLRAMAGEWEFNSSVFAVVAALVPREVAQAVCAGAFVIGCLVIFARWRQTAAGALPPGEWIFGAMLLLSATANPWYFLWLWPFVAARPAATGVCALAAVSLAYVTGLNLGDASLGNFAHPRWLRPLEYGAIALVALVEWRRTRKTPGAGSPAPGRITLR